MIIDNLNDLPPQFKEGVRIVMLMYRHKDGPIVNSQGKTLVYIVNGPDDWLAHVEHFVKLRLTSPYSNHRIYGSINDRNILKGVREFKRRQLDIDYCKTDLVEAFYCNLKTRFISCLMNKSSRNSKYGLVDCDDELFYEYAIAKIPKSHIVYDYPTKNGRHIIVTPYDSQQVGVKFKPDELMYIG